MRQWRGKCGACSWLGEWWHELKLAEAEGHAHWLKAHWLGAQAGRLGDGREVQEVSPGLFQVETAPGSGVFGGVFGSPRDSAVTADEKPK